MRWVFIALVLANIGVFFWHSVESSRLERLEALNTSSGENQGVISGAPLILVSELTEQEKRELMNAKVEPVATEVPATDVSVVETPVSKERNTADVRLNNEPAPSAAASISSMPEDLAQNTAIAAESSQCLKLGPLLNAAQAERVSQRLMAVAIITEVIDIEVSGKPEYWVVLPPFNDEKTALQKLQELQGRGLQPQIIPKGSLANAISFGLRGEKEEANKLAEELKAKGIRVEVRAVPVSRKEKWLALSERQAPKLTGQLWQEIHTDFPKVSKQVRNCH